MWLALTYYYSKHPYKALQTYQETLPLLDHTSPLVRGCTYVRMSNAYAQCSQGQEAIRYLRLAREVFPEHPEHDPGFLFADGGHFTIALWEGLTYLGLNQPENAWTSLAQFEQVPANSIPERIRIEIVNHQAETAIALRDQHLFQAYLKNGVMGAKALGSERRYNEAFDIYKQARSVSGVAKQE